MKRFLSPAYFAVAVICFFLPFVSVSCNAGALNETFGGEGVEGVDLPDAGVIEYEVTGWQIVTNSPPEFEGLEGLEDLGGEQQQPANEEDFPGRIWAIVALAAAVIGIGASLLSGRIGAISAIALGALGAISLFLMRGALTDRLGPAAIFGVEVGYKLGYWIALLMFVLALAVGVWRVLSERPAAAGVPGMDPMSPPGTAPPPGTPPLGSPPPEAPPPPPDAPPPA